MINKLEIKNFQSHKNSVLGFDKGLNVIIGETDTGKSSIIRALKLAIYNKPNGDSYCSNWGGETSVKLTFDNNKYVERIKSKSTNEYILSTIDEPFKAFGTTVPDEIVAELNMDEINLQQQMDSHFLISETPGGVALHFNKIAKIDRIDKTLNNITKSINTLNSETKHIKNSIEAKEKKLSEFIPIEQAEKQLKKIERLTNKRLLLNTKITNLNRLGNQLYTIEQEIHLAEKGLEAERGIDEILNLYKHKKNKQAKFNKIENNVKNYLNIKFQLIKLTNQLKAEASIYKLLKLYENKRKEVTSANKLQKTINTILSNQKQLKTKENKYNRLHKEYEVNFPDICPLCEK